MLQWARDGSAEHMDVYALPSAHEPTTLAAGLAAVMRSACEIVGQAALVERASNEAGLESFTNQLSTVDDSSAAGGGNNEALLHEARTLWGGIVNTCRNLQRQSNAFFSQDERGEALRNAHGSRVHAARGLR